MDELTSELAHLIKESGDEITEEYYQKLYRFFDRLALGCNHLRVPVEVWQGIAQAVADCSGYCVVLQAEILEPDQADPSMSQSVGRIEIASADPIIFIQE